MWIHLDYRTVVAVEGAHTDTFLQGLITKNMASLKAPAYGLMLTSKGRYAFDFFIVRHKTAVWLTPASADVEGFIKKLSLYLLQSDVQLTHLENHCVAVSEKRTSANSEGLVFQDPRDARLGHVYVGPCDGMDLSEDRSDYENLRLNHVVPEGPLDFEPGKTIPLEARMDDLGAIDFQKGCYLGQEFTSRTKHLGVVRKQFFAVKSKQPFVVGDVVSSGGEEIGSIKSTYQNGTKGFALLRCDGETSSLTVNHHPLVPV